MSDIWHNTHGLNERSYSDAGKQLVSGLQRMLKNLDYEHEEIISLNKIIKHDFLSVHFFYHSSLVELRNMVNNGLNDVKTIKAFLKKIATQFHKHAYGINRQLSGKAPVLHNKLSILVKSVIQLNHGATKNESEALKLNIHNLELLKYLEKRMGLLEMMIEHPENDPNLPDVNKMYIALERGQKDLFLKYLDAIINLSKDIRSSLAIELKGLGKENVDLDKLQKHLIENLKSIRVS